jgi:4-hydroxy-tetrahydrodipicolinate reductase
MSLGVNVLLKILPQLVRMLGPAYDMEMVEIHHSRKKDAPSGTASNWRSAWFRLADGCMTRSSAIAATALWASGRKRKWESWPCAEAMSWATIRPISSGRRAHRNHAPGAFTRKLAQGALRAAKWLARQKPGRLYDIGDLL